MEIKDLKRIEIEERMVDKIITDYVDEVIRLQDGVNLVGYKVSCVCIMGGDAMVTLVKAGDSEVTTHDTP